MENHMRAIVLFDGVCNLCNNTVKFIIKRDKKKKFLFGSLQSPAGQALLKQFHLPLENFHSFVYIKGNKYYLRSSAALHIAKDMGGFWKLFYVFIILPAVVRDFFYNRIANNRYRLFGKQNECMIPTPELKKRFLD